MRKIVGAWLLFCFVALPALLPDAFELAVKMRSGDRQHVPVVNDFPTGNSPSPSQELPPRFVFEPLVFFSTAPPESLALLPGIGPVLAARIRDVRGGKRPFTDWKDLLRVKGIGEKTVAKLRRLTETD
jgi:hypothetical protein